MTRRVGDERTRYGRRNRRERVEDVIAWPGQHPVGTLFLMAFLGVGIAFAASRGLLVGPDQLVAGDCLFVRVTSQSDERPIGEAPEVAAAVLGGRMEKAACDASHGHEVSAVVEVREPLPSILSPLVIERFAQPACEAAFEPFVGRSLEGSRYVTFAVYPDPPAWVASGRRTICLVARADGGWLDRPARGSAK